ncbi:MAG: hypothetical protein LBT22_05360, partial [Peptococcaceae bacterium]|nr:hypothetical protein [Peptococcaceae bacterium]
RAGALTRPPRPSSKSTHPIVQPEKNLFTIRLLTYFATPFRIPAQQTRENIFRYFAKSLIIRQTT